MNRLTKYMFLIFMIWRNIIINECKKQKEWLIIDIKLLNVIIKNNFYLMLTQMKIIVLIINAAFIIMINIITYFY